MKPQKATPAHHSPLFAELCCSNSLRSEMPENAVGLLKAEMLCFGSLIMEAAMATRVPAGSALAVDRDAFAGYITEKIKNHPLITVVEEECSAPIEGEITVIATGPLTSDAMADYIKTLVGDNRLHFFDAAAPIVDASTIDMSKAFIASRYGKGEACYVNCPMTKEEYDAFYEALIGAEEATLKEFDKESQKELTVFEGCMPVEVMARRGYETLLYGPMKPVGLPLPDTGKEAFAVLQLRQENLEKTMYNLVGFQTHLTFPEQKRVFRMIPGLENAEFIRYGVMHRNTFLNSPLLLDETYRVKENPLVYFAGQMTGVEGYVESAGSGLVAGQNAARQALGLEKLIFEPVCQLGAMARYVAYGSLGAFQPMNANFGIIEPLGKKVKGGKQARNKVYAERSLAYVEELKGRLDTEKSE
jgi:methylenetetrahydrofolate--tRNA-(uracil-5-)-methyltransferase